MTIGILSLTIGAMTLAAPAFADNEQYRLEVPEKAEAGKTLTGIRGSCAGDGDPSLLSDAFVGGKATVNGTGRFTAYAEIVDRTGKYSVRLICAGGKAGYDEVTVY
jgi:hypothetical protein